jgi:hypothetical protein
MTKHYRITLAFGVALTIAMGQGPSPWTVVRYPKDETFSVGLVTTSAPADCAKCDSPTPSGTSTARGIMKVTRDDRYTTIEFDIRGLPSNPGWYYLYTIDASGHAERLDSFRTQYTEKRQLDSDKYAMFMLIVSADGNIQKLPLRKRIFLYSVVPRGLRAVPR